MVFYFLWVSSSNSNDIISYALKYDPSTNQIIESSKCKKQGDHIAYILGLYGNNPKPEPPVVHYPDVIYTGYVASEISSVEGNLTNNTNNKTNNLTNNSSVNISKDVKEPENVKGNPNNILYNLGAICIIFAVFGASYSKR